MKKLFLMLVLILTMTSCVAQKTTPLEKRVLPNALVTQVIDNVSTLTYQGRTFEVDGTYVKGRKYYVILEVADCDRCDIVKGVTKVNKTSLEQAREDIEEEVKKYNEKRQR